MMKGYSWVRIVLSTVIVALAIVRSIFYDIVSRRLDNTFFFLLAAAALVLILPLEEAWGRLRSLRVGEIELVLDQPQVKGALDGLGLNRLEDNRLRENLSRLSVEINEARGSRVL
jgi:hypothetical protein